jgi:formylglycine-generating enzyme required for sulfatase activity
MEFVGIPAGSFLMGSPESEKDRETDEKQHRVTLSKGFWLGKYEVTIGEWKAVLGDLPEVMKSGLDRKFSKSDRQPVVFVSWDVVQEYIKKLNARGEGQYRLPTEAEWEYAARAGTTTAFAFGDSLNLSKANFDGNYPYNSVKGKYLEKIATVGSYQPNAWGVSDMHRNVWEWVQDWFGEYPGGSVVDPAGPSTGSFRVNRGGCWGSDGRSLRSANRFSNSPSNRYNNLGFRLVRE